jgi:hypothetical protein
MDPNNTYMYRAIEQLHPGRAASSKVIERETSIGNARANVIMYKLGSLDWYTQPTLLLQ